MIAYTNLKCSVCALEYCVDTVYMDERRTAPKAAKDRNWFCPNGHGQEYGHGPACEQHPDSDPAEVPK